MSIFRGFEKYPAALDEKLKNFRKTRSSEWNRIEKEPQVNLQLVAGINIETRHYLTKPKSLYQPRQIHLACG